MAVAVGTYVMLTLKSTTHLPIQHHVDENNVVRIAYTIIRIKLPHAFSPTCSHPYPDRRASMLCAKDDRLNSNAFAQS
jgi:peroxiredoxin